MSSMGDPTFHPYNMTPPCVACGHCHYINVGFTCSRFTCECQAISAVPDVVVDKGTMVTEKAPWRGLRRGDRAVIEPRSGTKYVPLSLRPLEGMQVLIAGYHAFRPGICSVREGQPHYHAVLPDDVRVLSGRDIAMAPFVCVPAGLVRALRANEVSVPVPLPETREPELIVRHRRSME